MQTEVEKEKTADSADRRRALFLGRIAEINQVLRSLGVEPEKENLSKMSLSELEQYGKAIAEQLKTRRKFLAG